ncbi:hypothetical protein WPS_08380 [Vulcanimicrobium alpinum]|uniref:Phospholipase/carboxylesterase/thioesterase domain-containing protein n=1 Tax=Vulcanimicrobium alpinum TaxID=3016050 RepID=A0AAN2C9F5_UNVUL|nr:PHB depolymerase family esterase [Vulcanimicrobium alpinum]BDE05562.1 hypothetical protein WPS_08380 [Vulcanimicrobium alpinum]
MNVPEPVARWRCGSCENRRGALIVLLHGRGADEDDLFPLADLLPREATVASLRAPHDADGFGYTWYRPRGVAQPEPASLSASLAYVDAFLRERAGDAEEIWLAGFSAGAVMAGALALHEPARFAGAALLHGPLAFDAPAPPAPGRLDVLELFFGYGVFDDVIPAAAIARTRAYLRDESGARLEEHAYRTGHDLPADEQRDLAAWFSARFAASLNPA